MITPRELFCSIGSIILGIIVGFLVNWDFSKLLTLETVVASTLLVGICGLAGYGFKPRVESYFQKYEKHFEAKSVTESTDYYPFKNKESKNSYHSHLVRDVCQVLEKQMQLENLPPTNALFELPEEKQNVILSHFFTAEHDSEKYRMLFSTYRSLLEFERSMLVKSRKVYDYLEEMEKYLLGLHYDNHSITKYTQNDFFLSIGISDKNELRDFYKIKTIYQKLLGYRPVVNYKIGEEYIVRINNKDVFKSSSYDISHKCEQTLIKKFDNFEKPFREAWISINLEVYSRIDQYNTTIKNYFEFIINGEPITGSCIGCLQYFTGNQKSKFENLLGEYEDEKKDLAKI